MIVAYIFAFIVYRTVSYIFERLFRPSGTSPNVYINIKAISSDRRYLRRRQRFNDFEVIPDIVDLCLKIISEVVRKDTVRATNWIKHFRFSM